MNNMAPRFFSCLALTLALLSTGCEPTPHYGSELQLFLPGAKRQVWAVAPAVNLSGQKGVDPLLQADLLYQQLQQVHGLTVVPVDRVVQVMAGLKMEKVQSSEQAAIVCDLLGCDALALATVTAFDPYDPPKFGGSVQVFAKPATFVRRKNINVHELSRAAAPSEDDSLPAPKETTFLQAVAMLDAANGTVRDAVLDYARGRADPAGPLGAKEYLVSMDRYCGFAYYRLVDDLLKQLDARIPKVRKK
ncbi:MAG TPA: hypothetical protein VG326_13215 [Tepidisphaeraceae bacterium]|jgi:hypothetical protein|nr:hypothetical protein [Tepidisphaeraceae bacterium]